MTESNDRTFTITYLAGETSFPHPVTVYDDERFKIDGQTWVNLDTYQRYNPGSFSPLVARLVQMYRRGETLVVGCEVRYLKEVGVLIVEHDGDEVDRINLSDLGLGDE